MNECDCLIIYYRYFTVLNAVGWTTGRAPNQPVEGAEKVSLKKSQSFLASEPGTAWNYYRIVGQLCNKYESTVDRGLTSHALGGLAGSRRTLLHNTFVPNFIPIWFETTKPSVFTEVRHPNKNINNNKKNKKMSSNVGSVPDPKTKLIVMAECCYAYLLRYLICNAVLPLCTGGTVSASRASYWSCPHPRLPGYRHARQDAYPFTRSAHVVQSVSKCSI